MKGFESQINDASRKFENQGKNVKSNSLRLDRFKEIPQTSQTPEKPNLNQNSINIPQNGPIKSYSNRINTY